MLVREWPAPALTWPRVPRVLLPLLGWVALAGLLVLGVGMPDNASFPYQGGLALGRAAHRDGDRRRDRAASSLGASLDIAPMRWIGERSYGLYLWHWPVWVLLADGLRLAQPTWLRSRMGDRRHRGRRHVRGRGLLLPLRGAADPPRRLPGATFARWAEPWRRGARAVFASIAVRAAPARARLRDHSRAGGRSGCDRARAAAGGRGGSHRRGECRQARPGRSRRRSRAAHRGSHHRDRRLGHARRIAAAAGALPRDLDRCDGVAVDVRRARGHPVGRGCRAHARRAGARARHQRPDRGGRAWMPCARSSDQTCRSCS